jgi:signal transduction histidine kinase
MSIKQFIRDQLPSVFFFQNSLAKNRLSKGRLQFLFTLFFLTLAIPSTLISYIAYEKLGLETFHQYQQTAQSFVLEINNTLNLAIKKEESRLDSDYSFLIVEGDPTAKFLQRSILSRYPVESDLPGIVGYFQVDSNGVFSSPLISKNSSQSSFYGLSNEEKLFRKQLSFNLHNILYKNQLVSKPSISTLYASSQDSTVEDEKNENIKDETVLGFSQLESATEKKLKKPTLAKLKKLTLPTLAKLPKRKEKSYIPQQSGPLIKEDLSADNEKAVSIKLFESEIEPFRFSLLKSGHFVAYRQVWRDGNRLIQGAILSVDDFFEQAINKRFERSPLSKSTRLSITYRDQLLSNYPAQTINNSSDKLLFSTNFSDPFSQLSLAFYLTDIPSGESGKLILLIASLLVLALVFGTFSLFRLTYRQSQLAQQHQDFISSVSHELKTPITSIQMYGEILKNGWVDEVKREKYYDFIYSESERLARLISNILQISKVSRSSLSLEMKPTTVNEIVSVIESKIDSQIKQSGFEYNISVEPLIKNKNISIDVDAFIQIIINLVDNAIKYSSNSSQKKIDITFSALSNNKISISVRDYGVGIAKSEVDKVFELFYRIGDELTRESKGTGIGLALVKELTNAMNGKIKVVNHNKGVEFVLCLAEVDS